LHLYKIIFWHLLEVLCFNACKLMRSLRQADVLQLDVLQANVGNYDASARYYVRALSLNPQAVNVWGYLRTSLACSGKVELMPAIDEEDLQHLQMELPME
jgi:tetratricopeptide (TPR) repeat protein